MRILVIAVVLCAVSIAFQRSQMYTNFRVGLESDRICDWINGDVDEVSFRVGPLAFEHLTKMRESGRGFSCKLGNYELNFGYKNEVSIIVSDLDDDFFLVYGYVRQRLSYRPGYAQHVSSEPSWHH